MDTPSERDTPFLNLPNCYTGHTPVTSNLFLATNIFSTLDRRSIISSNCSKYLYHWISKIGENTKNQRAHFRENREKMKNVKVPLPNFWIIC